MVQCTHRLQTLRVHVSTVCKLRTHGGVHTWQSVNTVETYTRSDILSAVCTYTPTCLLWVCPCQVYVLMCVCPSVCMSPLCVCPFRVYVLIMCMCMSYPCVCSLRVYVPSMCMFLRMVGRSRVCSLRGYVLRVYVPPCVCPSVCMSPPCECPLRVYVPSVCMSLSCVCPCHLYVPSSVIVKHTSLTIELLQLSTTTRVISDVMTGVK